MAEKPETKVKKSFNRAFKKLIDKLGLISWHEKIQQVTLRGTPDVIGCVGPCWLCGKAFFVAPELKIGKEEPNQLQALKLKKIRNAGGCSFVYRQPSDLVVLEEYLTRMPYLLDETAYNTLREYLIDQTLKRTK